MNTLLIIMDQYQLIIVDHFCWNIHSNEAAPRNCFSQAVEEVTEDSTKAIPASVVPEMESCMLPDMLWHVMYLGEL
jgi:hypothetical protein